MPTAGDALAFSRYREFLEANELELALDELEALASQTRCSPDLWRALLSAANRMGLTEHATRLSVALARADELAV